MCASALPGRYRGRCRMAVHIPMPAVSLRAIRPRRIRYGRRPGWWDRGGCLPTPGLVRDAPVAHDNTACYKSQVPTFVLLVDVVQETSIYRLNPRHNAVISVSTSNVSQGECDTCYVGITATVYRESWEWVVGAGDVLVDGSGVLSDDVLVEAGATYFIVLRQENIKRRLATETGVEAQVSTSRLGDIWNGGHKRKFWQVR